MIEYSPNLKLSESDKQFITNCLPQTFETKVINVHEKPKKELHICINAKTRAQTQKWIESYQALTNASYSIENTKKRKTFHIKRYNCVHNTRHREKLDPTKQNHKSVTKNLDCPAGVTIFLRNRKPTCEIKLRFYHNHSLNDPKLMKFRKVGPEIKAEIYNLFELGYKPATALKYLKNIVRLKFNNRHICPSYNFVYNLYGKYIIKNKIFDDTYVDNWLENLKEINDEEKYLQDLLKKSKIDETDAEFIITEDGYVICSCPPIAKRVQQFEALSREIIFIEVLQLSDSKIYLFLAPSEIGCLPLGLILTTSENISTLHVGFSLFKKQLENAPKVFVTDGNIPEQILQTIWPKSERITSAYHTLKNLWGWLTAPENKITKEDQSILFRDFYNVLYAGNNYTFETNFAILKTNYQKYENYKILLNQYYEKKQHWGTCYRPKTIKPLTDTIKYSEITIWFLKDMLLQKLKKLRFAHAVDYTVNIFFPYIKQRLLDLTNTKLRNQFYCDIKLPDERVLKKIQNIGPSLCFVPSDDDENLIFAVNISLCKCTCLRDNSASICQHIKWICKLNYSEKLYENLTKMENRKKCYAIATGLEFKKWLIKEDQGIYKITNDRYKIQIIDEEEDADVSSNKIKLDDDFVAGVFESVSHPGIDDM